MNIGKNVIFIVNLANRPPNVPASSAGIIIEKARVAVLVRFENGTERWCWPDELRAA